MSIISFPPVDKANEEGLLAVGGDLDLESLLLAYSKGIFPWPISEDVPLAWFSPDPRGILSYSDLHISTSLKKFIKKSNLKFKINHNFEKVIHLCATAQNRSKHNNTWITSDIIEAYIDCYKNGFAYSAETYLNDKLVGGLYGMCVDNFVSGESMFYLESNASKFALIELMRKLHKNNIHWLDTQMTTSAIEQMGGKSIPRTDYLIILKKAIQKLDQPNHKLFQN